MPPSGRAGPNGKTLAGGHRDALRPQFGENPHALINFIKKKRNLEKRTFLLSVKKVARRRYHFYIGGGSPPSNNGWGLGTEVVVD